MDGNENKEAAPRLGARGKDEPSQPKPGPRHATLYDAVAGKLLFTSQFFRAPNVLNIIQRSNLSSSFYFATVHDSRKW